jgi:hypothetical protein
MPLTFAMNIYDRKYQIFVSSTYRDLIEAREETIKVVLSLFQIPIGMEMFNADNEEQWITIQGTIDKTDYYLLIIGHRYGSLTKEGISFTEKEFDYAKANGIPILAFIRSRNWATSPEERDEDPKMIEKLSCFIKKVEANAMVDYWRDKHELGKKVSLTLTKQFHKGDRIGWIRADQVASPKILEELATLSKINRELSKEIESIRRSELKFKPEIGLLMNYNSPLIINFDNSFLNEISLLRALEEEDLDVRLRVFLDKALLQKYNAYINDNAKLILDYNESLSNFERIKKTKIPLEIQVINSGNVKAKEIYVDITFPPEILIYDKEKLADISPPDAPKGIPQNPLTKAENTMNIFSAFKVSTSPIIPLFGPIEQVNNNFWSEVKGPKVTIKLSQLLHTRQVSFDDFFMVPLKAGNFVAGVDVICEEFQYPVKFEYPIAVKEGLLERSN